MKMMIFVLISGTFFCGPLTRDEDALIWENRTAEDSAVRISDKEIKADLVSLVDDQMRVSPVTKVDTQALRARLHQEGEIVLSDTERSQIIAILRAYKVSPASLHTGKVDRLLFAIGDSDSIAKAVRLMSEGSPIQRLQLPDDLARSKQPAVITALVAELLVDEPIRPQLVGGDVRVTPRSVSATQIINRILIESNLFPEEVNCWARSLNAVKAEKRRAILRSWWNVNQNAMQRGDYMSTRPLSDPEQSLNSTDLKPQRRPVRRID
ncbi:MAG: hypothetical protein ACOX52_15710 [Verrucomicrobiota bacterium]|jgi:hypothetical protein